MFFFNVYFLKMEVKMTVNQPVARIVQLCSPNDIAINGNLPNIYRNEDIYQNIFTIKLFTWIVSFTTFASDLVYWRLFRRCSSMMKVLLILWL